MSASIAVAPVTQISAAPLGAAAAAMAAAVPKPDAHQHSVPLSPSNPLPKTRFFWVLLLIASIGWMSWFVAGPAAQAIFLGKIAPPMTLPVAALLLALYAAGVGIQMRLAGIIVWRGL